LKRTSSSATGITKAAVGLGNVDNTSDASKPVSSATQAVFDARLGSTGDQVALAAASTPRFSAVDRVGGMAASVGLTASRLYLVAFTAAASAAVSNFYVRSRGTAGVGTTLARMALFSVASNGNATLLARTASDTTLAAATFTDYTKAFDTTGGYPANYALVAGTRYALGILLVGSSTAAQVYGASVSPSANSWLPWASMAVAAQTDIATSYTYASMVVEGGMPALVAL
jgi:hypothetical protein